MTRKLAAACVATFALAGVLAGGGAVWARTTASQIDACVEQRTGYLVVGRGCAGQPLTWNVEGPQGPQGPPGPQGLPGAAGPPGKGLEPRQPAQDEIGLRTAPPKGLRRPAKPSASKLLSQLKLPDGQVWAWSAFHDQKIDVPNVLSAAVDPGSAWGVVAAHLDVPAGRYVAFAKAEVFRKDMQAAASEFALAVRCTLVAGADYDVASAGEWSTVALNVVHAFAKPGRIELRCSSWGLVAQVLENVKVTAVRVASLKNAYVDSGPLLTG
jgi:hypothetical protein